MLGARKRNKFEAGRIGGEKEKMSQEENDLICCGLNLLTERLEKSLPSLKSEQKELWNKVFRDIRKIQNEIMSQGATPDIREMLERRKRR